MMNRTTNKEHLFIGLALNNEISKPEVGITLVKISRNEFANVILDGKVEQLAALGIMQLINIIYGIDFVNDKNIIDKIWPSHSKNR